MREDLLEKLEEWHEEDEFEEIVDAIEEIPENERDYTLISHLGRALNNLGRYDQALEQFMKIQEEGQDDSLWHYRVGLAYYYLGRYEESETAFRRSDELEPGDEDTLEFLEWIESKKAKKKRAAASAPASTPVDPDGFWDDSHPDAHLYISEQPTDDLIASIEEQLVFKLPASYVDQMKLHNGGVPRRRYFPAEEDLNGGGQEIEITGIFGIGRDKKKSLCGTSGSRSIIEKGDYPEIGVVICDTPSDTGVVMLDYRESGNDGEPEIVYVDKASRQIVTLAPSFDVFINGLVSGRE